MTQPRRKGPKYAPACCSSRNVVKKGTGASDAHNSQTLDWPGSFLKVPCLVARFFEARLGVRFGPVGLISAVQVGYAFGLVRGYHRWPVAGCVVITRVNELGFSDSCLH